MALLRTPLAEALLHIFFVAVVASTSQFQRAPDEAGCRFIPGDPGWPDASAWDELNATVSGKLIATTPLAAPCHDPHYDATACTLLRAQWAYPRFHIESPSSIMSPSFQNGSCDPFQPASKGCPLGDLVHYSVKATSVSDVKAAVRFARENIIRLVIKNTGHDYLGKSTGKNALGLWTHHLSSIEVNMNYSSKAYSGPTLKLGAGVQAAAAYRAAHSTGHRIVGGRCPTTGIAGGFLMGGGHSHLSGTHGLASDNVLEWEVVTANGTHTTATPDRNADLYWALSGGGGGTYAVVVSATIKMYRDDGPIGGASLIFNATSTTSTVEDYWTAISVALAGTGPIIDTGAFFAGIFTNVRASFTMTAPGQTAEQVRGRLQFLVDYLDSRGIPYAFNVSTHSNYFDHFVDYYGPLPDAGINIAVRATSRIIPRSIYDAALSPAPASPLVAAAPTSSSAPSVAELTSVYRIVASEPGWKAINIAIRPSPPHAPPVAANAVHPAWRTAGAIALIYAPWDFGAERETAAANAARERKLTDVVDPAFRALTPQSGTYLNEANWAMRDLLRESYGSNLARLWRVKQRYDPEGVFYAPHAVGSDQWAVDMEGRLCRQQPQAN